MKECQLLTAEKYLPAEELKEGKGLLFLTKSGENNFFLKILCKEGHLAFLSFLILPAKREYLFKQLQYQR